MRLASFRDFGEVFFLEAFFNILSPFLSSEESDIYKSYDLVKSTSYLNVKIARVIFNPSMKSFIIEPHSPHFQFSMNPMFKPAQQIYKLFCQIPYCSLNLSFVLRIVRMRIQSFDLLLATPLFPLLSELSAVIR